MAFILDDLVCDIHSDSYSCVCRSQMILHTPTDLINILCIGLFTFLLIIQLTNFYFSKKKFVKEDYYMVLKILAVYILFCGAVLMLTDTLLLPGMSGLR